MRALLLSFFIASTAHAAVIGRSKPAEPLTEARIMTLSVSEQNVWLQYLHRSEAQMAADKAVLAREREGLTELPPLPKQGFSGRAIPLHNAPEFYRSDEARRIGDIILSFQTPAGGWSKNLAMDAPRLRGQSYAAANLAPVASAPQDFDAPRDEKWHYVGTLDNDATNTELHFLAELSAALPGHDGDVYRTSFLRGVAYLLHAQFPNGGWPQVWPLEGGYHDAITFNDDAVTESAEVLGRVAAGQRVNDSERAPEDFTFIPTALRAQARAAVGKALSCILATQLRVPVSGGGTVLAIWAQQNDPLTLKPVTARNYEPEALSSGESASVMEYLMALPLPSVAVVQSVDAAAAWFQAHKIMGYEITGGRGQSQPRGIAPKAGAGPLWPRYSSLTTGQPIFGDRDKTIHDRLDEISVERRNGYAWYGSGPAAALATYAEWKPKHTGHVS